ncbi:MAG: L-aspartate oxidase [Epsilonproteobacteria bacterium]|nr:L-aspartate oxidase [Campylobacterota bacterium]
MQIFDVVIVGAGIAGLNTALNIPKDKKVLILCKENSWDCNTFYAQGGISVPVDEEDIELHIKDTLLAGAGLCDEDAVRVLCSEGMDAVKSLMDRGLEFDKDNEGNLLYTKEAAHSRNRILHAGGDATGRVVHLFLMQNNPHPLMYKTTVVDILKKDDRVYGVRVFHKGKFKNIYCKNLVLASGGIGSLYEFHTNSRTISADIQGLALECGCELRDMEMTQFHPTVFVNTDKARKQLLSESLRGEGAYVVNEKGERFLFDYDERGELSPRDIVSRAIFDYKQKHKGERVYLSFENFEKSFFKKRFPTIYYNLKDLGFNLPEERVPISPAFHYAMGGIKCDLDTKVANFRNLFVVGEVASTRVHGANRLASNSLLEGIVFSIRAAKAISRNDTDFSHIEFEDKNEPLFKEGDKEKKNELRKIMWDDVGIIRSREKLKSALHKVDMFIQEDIGKLLRLRLRVSKEIIKSALNRKESLGAHYIKE